VQVITGCAVALSRCSDNRDLSKHKGHGDFTSHRRRNSRPFQGASYQRRVLQLLQSAVVLRYRKLISEGRRDVPYQLIKLLLWRCRLWFILHMYDALHWITCWRQWWTKNRNRGLNTFGDSIWSTKIGFTGRVLIWDLIWNICDSIRKGFKSRQISYLFTDTKVGIPVRRMQFNVESALY